MAVEPIVFPEPLEGAAAPPARPAVTVAAFIGRTERGPVDEAVAVSSFDDYRRVFGGHSNAGFVSQAVQHYFLHGGRAAVVVRLANCAARAVIDVPAGEDVLRLVARRPGSREYLRVSVDYDRVVADARRFNLVVQRLSRPGSSLVEDQELYSGVSLDPNDRLFIVDALRDSELVRLSGPLPRFRPDATLPAHPGDPIPYLDMSSPGTDGDELTDYDIIGSNEEGTGLFALDRAGHVDIVCVPPPPSRDYGTTALLAAERYCRRRRALLIWDPPWSWYTSERALLGLRALGLTSSNAMTYFPRLRPRGQLARFPAGLPACGALAGLLAASDEQRGFPGAPRDYLKSSLTTLIDLDEQEAALLRRHGINPLAAVGGGGVLLDGNATLMPQDRVPTAVQRLDASRTTLHVLEVIERSTSWAARAIGEAGTGVELEKQVRALLADLHSQGALAGRGTDDTFFVRLVPRGADAVALRIGFAVVRAGEFRTYELEYRAGRATAREVPPLDVC